MLQDRTGVFRGREAGFSLIEVLVVVAIIALTGAMSLILIGQQLPGMRFQSGLTSLRGGITSARMQAIRSSRNVIMNFNFDRRTMDVWLDDDNSASIDAGEQMLFSIDLPPAVVFGMTGGAPASGPSGYATSDFLVLSNSSLTHHIITAGTEYQLILNRRGRLVDPAGPETGRFGAMIYISNQFERLGAVEILSGGVVIPWEYNLQGDNTWQQK